MYKKLPPANFPAPKPPPNQFSILNNPEDILLRLKKSGSKLKELLNINDEMIDRAIKEVRRDT
jgi:hypothetical protein